MYFVDYGNNEEVRAKDLKVLKDEFREYPPYAVLCALNNVSASLTRNDLFSSLVDSAEACVLLRE